MIRSAISPKPKLTRCKVCHERFRKVRSIQPTCDDFECKVEYASRAAAKAAAKRVKAVKKADAAQKQAMQPKKWWKAKAKKALHAFIRARDEGKNCISCEMILVKLGRVGGDYDAGHFRSVGSAKHMEFVENNIHGQCKHCNDYLAGNHANYERGLIERFGQEYVDALYADNTTRHLGIDDYQAIEAEYKTKLKELLANKGVA